MDHGKKSLGNVVAKVFQDAGEVHMQNYDLLMDEESLVARRSVKRRRFVKQTENLYVVAADLHSIPDTRRRSYSGSSRGQC